MWILASWGAIMPSLRKGCPKDDPRKIQVRVRRLKDAIYFRDHYLTETFDAEAEVVTEAGTDYDARLYVRQDSLGEALARMALDIDYASFKDTTTSKFKDNQLHDAYYAIWRVLYDRLSTRKAFSRYSKAQGHWTNRGAAAQSTPFVETTRREVVETKRVSELTPSQLKLFRMSDMNAHELAALHKEIDRATDDIELPTDEEVAKLALELKLGAPIARGPRWTRDHLDHTLCDHDATKSARRRCRKAFLKAGGTLR
jgi:hypothetical protein